MKYSLKYKTYYPLNLRWDALPDDVIEVPYEAYWKATHDLP